MSTFGDRLRSLLEEVKIRPSQLAVETGKARQTISSYLSNRTEPDLEFFKNLKLVISNLSVDWLITGSGQMFLSETASSDDVKDLKSKLTDLQIREKQLTDTIIRMGSMLGTGAVGQGDRSKSKGVFNPGNWAYKRTVINTPWLA